MTLAVSLQAFRDGVSTCTALIATAHQRHAAGQFIFGLEQRDAITVAAFQNMFKHWEGFLEASITKFLAGSPGTSRRRPRKYVRATSIQHASSIVVGTQRFFDYANHEYVKKIVNLYFENGGPFEPHLTAIFSELQDLRIMRNASAHISSSTQSSLDSLAQRLFTIPQPGITLYDVLMRDDPQSPPGISVFEAYRAKLDTVADLISVA